MFFFCFETWLGMRLVSSAKWPTGVKWSPLWITVSAFLRFRRCTNNCKDSNADLVGYLFHLDDTSLLVTGKLILRKNANYAWPTS